MTFARIAVATLKGNVHFFSMDANNCFLSIKIGVAIFANMLCVADGTVLLVASVDGCIAAIDAHLKVIWKISNLKGPIFNPMMMIDPCTIIIFSHKRIVYTLSFNNQKIVAKIETGNNILIHGNGVLLEGQERSLIVCKSVDHPISVLFMEKRESDIFVHSSKEIDQLVAGENSYTGIVRIPHTEMFVMGTRVGDRILLLKIPDRE